MEPITVTSKLDLATYYKISMAVILKRPVFIILFILFLILAALYVYDGVYDLDTTIPILIWGASFLIILPVTTWFRCRANMTKLPVLAEGTVYTISEDAIQNVSPSCSTTSKWSMITKAVEADRYFILYVAARQIHFLPKDGFADQHDIQRLKEMAKANRIKAYFK